MVKNRGSLRELTSSKGIHRRVVSRRPAGPSDASQFSLLELLESRTLLSGTYMVTTVDDAGPGSLRQAIIDANASLGHDNIEFNIGSGIQQISLLSPLPAITDEVTLDGTTQSGYAGTPLIWLDGSGFASPANGLTIVASNSTVRGLAITGFNQDGILIQGSGNHVLDSFIGVDPTGTIGVGNSVDGVEVNGIDGAAPASADIQGNVISANWNTGIAFSRNFTASDVSNNRIGVDVSGSVALGNWNNGIYVGQSDGVTPSLTIRDNVISSNYGDGIQLDGSANAVVAGNVIGTDATGTSSSDAIGGLFNNFGNGVSILGGATGNRIGGPNAGDRNLIANSFGDGVQLKSGTGNVIQGNYIGTNLNGTEAIGNYGNGVSVLTGGNRVVGNLLSGNYGDGADVEADANTIYGNFVGTQADGLAALANLADGICIDGSGNVVGGAEVGKGNVIAFNIGNGITVKSGVGNAIRGNSIYANASGDPGYPGIGIDLGYDGVTLNDSTGHAGANLNQNFPVLTAAKRSGSSMTVDGTLAAAPSRSFTIDFYTDVAADPSGYGQGRTYVGSVVVTTDAAGSASFHGTLDGVPTDQPFLTATVTDSAGNTSEFGLVIDIVKQVGGSVARTATTLASSVNPALVGQSVTLTAMVTNLLTSGIPAGSVQFREGSTLLGTGLLDALGQATLTTCDLTIGTHSIVATYIGNPDFLYSESEPLSQTVNPLPSTLGGHVFVDADNDAWPDAGEKGIAGVDVSLLGIDDLGDEVSLTVQTDGAGAYLFTGLRPGTYSLAESQPAGYLQGKVSAGTLAGAVGDDLIDGIVVEQNHHGTDYNFGELLAGTISGKAFLDSNDSNTQDTGETGIGGVTVNLTGTDDLGNLVSVVAQTNSSGLYAFSDLRPGTYAVTETQPGGYIDAAGAGNVLGGIGIVSGSTIVNKNFAEIQPGSLAGYAYLDANKNGIREATEAGISGVTVTLTGTNDLNKAISVSAQTGLDGDYLFDALRPGTYKVAETQPSGYQDGLEAVGSLGGTAGNDFIDVINLASGNAGTGYNFAEQVAQPSPGKLSGRGLVDKTGNGLSGDDVAMAGLTINLYLDRNNDGVLNDGSPVASMVTPGDTGAYSFAGLQSGRYFVQEVTPCGYVLTAPALSSYYTVQVTDGVNAGGLDFDNFLKLDTCRVSGVSYLINSSKTVSDLRGNTKEGDLVQVVFTITDGAPVQLSLVSYTAPDSTFVAGHASQQVTFDTDTGFFGPGTYTMSVTDPDSYYQVDFVVGPAISQLGPANSNIFYGAQGRLISADNEGVDATMANGSGISGTIYSDVNLNGKMDAGEVGLGNVNVTLTGTDNQGHAVRIAMLTDLDGQYKFSNLRPGTYSVTESQPVDFIDGEQTLGTAGGKIVAIPASGTSAFSGIVLGQGVQATGNNFGELAMNLGSALQHGQAATILFWKSSLGQTLIKSFNGSSNSTALGNWLATNFPHLYGAQAGSHNLAGKTDTQVASMFTTLYNLGGMRLDAQVMSLALSVYATNSKLAGTAAQKYGFLVDTTGAGATTYNVGDSGASFDVATNTTMRVLDILKETDGDTVNGVLYSNSLALCSLANLVYVGINTIGGVS